MNLVEKITKDQIRTDLPEFRVGDTIIVGYHIKEGNKERVQDFEGIVKAIKGSGVSKNFIVRKISSGVGVEKTYAMNSPRIAYVKVVRKGKVRRAKLNYLSTLLKQPRIKERRDKVTK
jgi:ribosomal protein L19